MIAPVVGKPAAHSPPRRATDDKRRRRREAIAYLREQLREFARQRKKAGADPDARTERGDDEERTTLPCCRRTQK